MPINLPLIQAGDLLPIAGLRLGIGQAGVKKAHKDDLTLIALCEGTSVAGVFTTNRFRAAPVQVCQAVLQNHPNTVRALLINTGNANAGTGESGLIATHTCCKALAAHLQLLPHQVLPFSTGVIMEPLPTARIVAALPDVVKNLQADNWYRAAHAIMTTDTQAKAYSRQIAINQQRITITGMSKGAGMIRPNMATMLGFMATDANIAPAVLAEMTRNIANQSFNRISVDGDTSTNDSFVLMATGQCLLPCITDLQSAEAQALQATLLQAAQHLAHAIVRDAEGATKFITVRVTGGAHPIECTQVAYAIAHSPLVKTAFFASDPNLGRILAAVGYAGIADMDASKVNLYLDDVHVVKDGGLNAAYLEADGQRVMQQPEIAVCVDLGRGPCSDTVWTCDLSHDYVSINADYRS